MSDLLAFTPTRGPNLTPGPNLTLALILPSSQAGGLRKVPHRRWGRRAALEQVVSAPGFVLNSYPCPRPKVKLMLRGGVFLMPRLSPKAETDADDNANINSNYIMPSPRPSLMLRLRLTLRLRLILRVRLMLRFRLM